MDLLDENYGQKENPFAAISIENVQQIMLQYEKLLRSLVNDKVLGKQCLANPAFP